MLLIGFCKALLAMLDIQPGDAESDAQKENEAGDLLHFVRLLR